MLNLHLALEVFPPLKADGVFGPATDARVRNFQTRNGLLVDGIVGRQTRRSHPRLSSNNWRGGRLSIDDQGGPISRQAGVRCRKFRRPNHIGPVDAADDTADPPVGRACPPATATIRNSTEETLPERITGYPGQCQPLVVFAAGARGAGKFLYSQRRQEAVCDFSRTANAVQSGRAGRRPPVRPGVQPVRRR